MTTKQEYNYQRVFGPECCTLCDTGLDYTCWEYGTKYYGFRALPVGDIRAPYDVLCQGCWKKLPKSTRCSSCGASFSSGNQLHKHLRENFLHQV